MVGIAKRHFTASEVEQHFRELFTNGYEGSTIEVHYVALLDTVMPTMWLIDYSLVSPSSTGVGHHRFHATLLVGERIDPQGKAELLAVSMTRLPKRCTTVEDEDKIIASYENSGW